MTREERAYADGKRRQRNIVLLYVFAMILGYVATGVLFWAISDMQLIVCIIVPCVAALHFFALLNFVELASRTPEMFAKTNPEDTLIEQYEDLFLRDFAEWEEELKAKQKTH